MTLRTLSAFLALIFLVPLTASVASSAVEFASGERQVSLVELYTSEGCSSCPPADRWLSGQAQQPGLWRDFVPVAFHVDYWDSLGWKDRFAKSTYSARQRRYAAEGGVGTVYTPGVVYNGREWRNWRAGGRIANTDRGQKKNGAFNNAGGVLRATLNDGALSIRFAPPRSLNETAYVNVALLGSNLSTAVRAGENSGRTLEHDFVVLGMQRRPLEKAAGGYIGTVALPKSSVEAARRSVAIWVNAGEVLQPLQATGGWLE